MEQRRQRRRGLYEILVEAKRQMTPSELYDRAGFAYFESMFEFFRELRDEVANQRIMEIRPNEVDVYLKAVGNEN